MAARTSKKKIGGELDAARSRLEDALANITRGDSHDEEEDENDTSDSSPQLKRRRSRGKDKKLL